MLLKEGDGQTLTANITVCEACPGDGHCPITKLVGRIRIPKAMPSLDEIDHLAEESGLIYVAKASGVVDGVPDPRFGLRIYKCTAGIKKSGHGQIDLTLAKVS